MANHSHNNGHEMHWTPRVLAREEDTTKRKIKEALAIKKVTNGRRDGVIINHDSGMKISKLWLDLVFKKKKKKIFFEKQIVLTLLNRRCVHQWRSCTLHVVGACVWNYEMCEYVAIVRVYCKHVFSVVHRLLLSRLLDHFLLDKGRS